MAESIQLNAKAKVKITKLDDAGNVIGVEEHEVNLTEEEAKAIWDSQQQE